MSKIGCYQERKNIFRLPRFTFFPFFLLKLSVLSLLNESSNTFIYQNFEINIIITIFIKLPIARMYLNNECNEGLKKAKE